MTPCPCSTLALETSSPNSRPSTSVWDHPADTPLPADKKDQHTRNGLHNIQARTVRCQSRARHGSAQRPFLCFCSIRAPRGASSLAQVLRCLGAEALRLLQARQDGLSKEVGFQVAEAHQQVPHLHRPRYSTHPSEEALQKAKRGQASIGCQHLQQAWPTLDTTAAAALPNFSDLGRALLQAATGAGRGGRSFSCRYCVNPALWMG